MATLADPRVGADLTNIGRLTPPVHLEFKQFHLSSLVSGHVENDRQVQELDANKTLTSSSHTDSPPSCPDSTAD